MNILIKPPLKDRQPMTSMPHKYQTIPGNIIQSNLAFSTFSHSRYKDSRVRVRVMVFNTTFNNISVISWQSVVAIYDSNWYIKCLNNIIIDKKKMHYFWALSHNFRMGLSPPLQGVSISGLHTAASPVLSL